MCLGQGRKIVSQMRLEPVVIRSYTTLTNLNTKYLEMGKVYTDVGGIHLTTLISVYINMGLYLR